MESVVKILNDNNRNYHSLRVYMFFRDADIIFCEGDFTKEQIEQITNTSVNDQAFKIFQTPGKLLNLTEAGFNDIIDLAGKTVMNIGRAEYANALVIATKINYKDLYNKIDFDLFLDAVEYLALEDYKNNTNPQSFIIFQITNKFKQYATQQRLIKEVLMINYITTLWEALRG